MDKVFGLPMSGVAVVLVILLAVCLLSVVWVAIRKPVVFKMGMRNIPRRRAQTILIVVGLMLSTLIISAALGTGDTVDHSVSAEIYRTLGPVDEVVAPSPEMDGNLDLPDRTMDESVVQTVERGVQGNDRVDGVMPMLVDVVPVLNNTRSQSEPNVYLSGLDPDRLADFGGLEKKDGGAIDLAALSPNEVVLSEDAADKLDAEVGDQLTVYYDNQPIVLTVAEIAKNSYVGGEINIGDEALGIAMPLARLQELTGQQGRISAIVVSNRGGTREGITGSDAVENSLIDTATAYNQANPTSPALGVEPIKHDAVDEAESIAQVFSGLFLVLGLFSVAAGILLIVLIFTMLAAERRPEMGMARAVGQRRGQLIQQFIAEGSGYAILAGLVGSALGVVASFGIAWAMRALFGQYFDIEASVTPRSMIVAYCLGVVITFAAVVGSSWKVSRLNIVAAVRDIPDEVPTKRNKRVLVWGLIMTIAGAGLLALGQSSGTMALHGIGFSLALFGLARIGRFFGVPGRPVYSLVSILILLYWLLPEKAFEAIFGDGLDGDFEMFFISGISMVIAATFLIVQNLDVLLAGVSRLGGLFKDKLPAVRTAIAYPGAAKGRTGMTIAMFSLIVFSLVMIATMNQNFVNLFLGDDANAGWDIRTDVGDSNPLSSDFTQTLAASGAVDTSQFDATGTVITPDYNSRAKNPDDTEWGDYPVRGMDESFLDNATLTFQQRAVGYDTDAAIIEALKSQPNVAVVDVSAIESDDFGDGSDFQIANISTSDKTFEPITIQIENEDGQAVPVTIIGVIDSKIGSLYGIYTNTDTATSLFPSVTPQETSYYVALAHPDQAKDVATEIEATLLGNGAQSVSIRDELKDDQKESTGFLYLIQGFMGLGLFVGVAAVGVIAFRSVVERRQQIGVLRSLGFQKSMVALSFLIETAFIVGMGVISGTFLGIVLARNLFTSDEVGSSSGEFLVPWPIISVILLATIAVALLMTWIPSRQAASIAPAEALRYE